MTDSKKVKVYMVAPPGSSKCIFKDIPSILEEIKNLLENSEVDDELNVKVGKMRRSSGVR